MNNGNKGSGKLLFFGGLLTGAIGAYYLNTEHGKELTKKIIKKTTDITREASEKVSALSEQVVSESENLFTKVKQDLHHYEDKIKDGLKETSALAKKELSHIQKGVNIAKEKLNNSSLS